jgi:hypothetical protein
MAEETFGVSLEQHLANRAGLDTTPAAQGMWQKYVGGPTGQLAQGALNPLQTAASEVAGGTFNPSRVLQSFRPGGETGTMAQMLNPWQTPTQAGITVGTAGAGGLASRAGLSTAKQAGARILGAGAGGGLGGAAEGGVGGAAVGTGIGLLSGGIGEGIGAAADYLRQVGVNRAKLAAQDLDARKAVDALTANKKLGGVFQGHLDPARPRESIEDLFKGYTVNPVNGRAENKAQMLMSARMQQADDVIQGILQQKAPSKQFPIVTEGSKSVPGQFGTYANAREALSEFGYIVGKAKPHQTYKINGEELSGREVKQLYAETLRVFQKGLGEVDPQALQTFNDSRAMYEAGQYLAKKMPKLFTQMNAEGVQFNSDALQKSLANSRKEGVNKLGEEGFWRLGEAVRVTPETIGRADVYQPSGAAAALAGVVPLPGAAYARVHVGRPSLVSPQGVNPLAMMPGSRTGISLGTEQLVGPGLQNLLPPAQGIPGLQ